MAKVIGFDTTVMKRCTCKKCGAIIEYSPNEVTKVKEYDYSGGCDVYDVVACPNCHKKVYV